ncbi:hypothetical protein Hanom_Chr17g01537511 [Helianthus anomalus]
MVASGDRGVDQWRRQKFFLMMSFFMDTTAYSNPGSNFLNWFGSSRVKSHNKNKYHSKSTMSLNKKYIINLQSHLKYIKNAFNSCSIRI